MSKHTPGPWVADDDGCVFADHETPGQKLVAEMYNDARHANTRLIAAAPELKEGCLEAALLLEHICKGYPDIACDTRVTRVQRQLDAAIARARGEE